MKLRTLITLVKMALAVIQFANAFALEPRHCCTAIGGGMNGDSGVCSGQRSKKANLIRIDGTATTPCCGYGSIYQHEMGGTD